jgi:hypothetical protein
MKIKTQDNAIQHSGRTSFMLSIINKPFMLSVCILNAVMLSVISPSKVAMSTKLLNITLSWKGLQGQTF